MGWFSRKRVKKRYEVECILEFNGEPIKKLNLITRSRSRREAKKQMQNQLNIKVHTARQAKKRKY